MASQTGGFCFDCASSDLNERLKTVDLAHNGGVSTVSTAKSPKSGRNRRQHERRKGDPRVKRRRKAAERAKMAAWRRLAAACPELYALILADERHKRGLTPISVRRALESGPGELAWATLDALAFYRSAASPENCPDDPLDPTQDPAQARN